MSLLARYSTAAERRRYCVFAEGFERSDLIRENGGAVSEVLPVNFGITFAGYANRNVDYTLLGQELDTPVISFVLEFTPAFDLASHDGETYLSASDVGTDDYLIRHILGETNRFLRIRLGDTLIVDIPNAGFEDYWLTGERNVLVVSSVSEITNVWFNGICILEDHPQAWTPTRPLNMQIGTLTSGGSPFDGVIHSVKIFHCLLNATEALDYYDYGKPPPIVILGLEP